MGKIKIESFLQQINTNGADLIAIKIESGEYYGDYIIYRVNGFGDNIVVSEQTFNDIARNRARHIILSDSQIDTSTMIKRKMCWDCYQREGEECGIDGSEVYEDSIGCIVEM